MGRGVADQKTTNNQLLHLLLSPSSFPLAFLANSLRVLLSSPTPPFSLPREGREKERGRREEMYCRPPLSLLPPPLLLTKVSAKEERGGVEGVLDIPGL